MKQKYYAIKGEDKNIIASSWEEAQELMKEMVKPRVKSFSTQKEAEAFLNGEESIEAYDEPTAYIDGSFDHKTNRYSFGAILLVGGEIFQFKKAYPEDEYSPMRNVAGELKGAGFIIQYAINRGYPKLHIFYDYNGIEKWYRGQWRANSPISIKYRAFAEENKNKIEIVFHKVKSHTNNYYNELVDKLAKEALEL